MNQEPAILASAKLLEALGDRHWRAELANSAPCIAHLPKEEFALYQTLKLHPEAMVILELTPYDFRKGRIRSLQAT